MRDVSGPGRARRGRWLSYTPPDESLCQRHPMLLPEGVRSPRRTHPLPGCRGLRDDQVQGAQGLVCREAYFLYVNDPEPSL